MAEYSDILHNNLNNQNNPNVYEENTNLLPPSYTSSLAYKLLPYSYPCTYSYPTQPMFSNVNYNQLYPPFSQIFSVPISYDFNENMYYNGNWNGNWNWNWNWNWNSQRQLQYELQEQHRLRQLHSQTNYKVNLQLKPIEYRVTEVETNIFDEIDHVLSSTNSVKESSVYSSSSVYPQEPDMSFREKVHKWLNNIPYFYEGDTINVECYRPKGNYTLPMDKSESFDFYELSSNGEKMELQARDITRLTTKIYLKEIEPVYYEAVEQDTSGDYQVVQYEGLEQMIQREVPFEQYIQEYQQQSYDDLQY
ncbi:uncharacterized protein RJT21DRAFT_133018 [Scheffersomyces amazonensis]|uniref:uncharacterized protein n=1 Tax=Scheffersomyces amazonensis TaxID=1078765 RepID=UPI00315D7FCF